MSELSDNARTFWKEYWTGIYSTPRAWAHKGQNLIHAFEALASASTKRSMDFDVHDQTLMLAGMASEVLLKALLVHYPQMRTTITTQRKQLDDAGKELHKVFYSHDLVRLASVARVALSDDQRGTAHVLSEFISWRGRYVLPTEASLEDLVPIPLHDGHVGMRHLSVTVDASRILLNRLIDEVKVRLYGDPAR